MNISSTFDLPVEFIEFQNEASANAATAQQDHSISDIIVKAISASNWYEYCEQKDRPRSNTIENVISAIDDMKLTPEENILKIFNDDDCLAHILKHLSLRDLCAAAEVCSKFKSSAIEAFSHRFTELRILSDISVDGIFACSDGEILFDGGDSMALLQSLFRNFGSCLKSLHLNGTHMKNEQIQQNLQILGKFGLSGAISTLKIEGFQVENIPTEMLSNLKCLTISSSDQNHKISNSLEVCHELIELHLIKPKYTTFCVGAMTPEQFISGCSKAADSQSHDCSASKIFRSIGLNMQKLELLEIETIEDSSMNLNSRTRDVIYLARLKHLNTLSLDCSELPITDLLKALVEEKIPIKDLSLFGVCFDSGNNYLSMLTQMEKLKISGRNIESDTLQSLFKGLPFLKEVYLWDFDTDWEVVKEITVNCKELSLLECTIGLNSSKLTIEDTDYVSIVDLVKNRNNDIKLLIRIDNSPWCRLKVSMEIIDMNRQWLNIEIPDSVDWSEDEDDDPEVLKIMNEISIFLNKN